MTPYLRQLYEIRALWQRILDANPGSSARTDLANVNKAIAKAERRKEIEG